MNYRDEEKMPFDPDEMEEEEPYCCDDDGNWRKMTETEKEFMNMLIYGLLVDPTVKIYDGDGELITDEKRKEEALNRLRETVVDYKRLN